MQVQRGTKGQLDIDVYDAAGLHPGHLLQGPALIDGTDTTVWVPQSATVHVNPHGTLKLEVQR